MALLVDTKHPEPIKVGDRTYHMRPASVAERARWRRAIAAAGGRQHGPAGLLNCLSAGVRHLMKETPAEVREAVLEKIDAQRSRVHAFFETARAMATGGEEEGEAFRKAALAVSEGDAGLAVIVGEVTANYPAFAQMVADEQVYWPIVGMESLRMFCTGWDGIAADLFQRGPDGMSDASLAEVPEADLEKIGQLYQNLVTVTPSQRKNLASLRSSSSGSETSST